MLEIPLNYGWEFVFECTDGFLSGGSAKTETVDLPHTCAATPFDYFDESVYRTVCGYRKRISVPAEWAGKRIFLNIGASSSLFF